MSVSTLSRWCPSSLGVPVSTELLSKAMKKNQALTGRKWKESISLKKHRVPYICMNCARVGALCHHFGNVSTAGSLTAFFERTFTEICVFVWRCFLFRKLCLARPFIVSLGRSAASASGSSKQTVLFVQGLDCFTARWCISFQPVWGTNERKPSPWPPRGAFAFCNATAFKFMDLIFITTRTVVLTEL